MEILFNVVEEIYVLIRNIGFVVSPRKHFRHDPPGYKPEKFSAVLSKEQTFSAAEIWDSQITLLHPFDANKPSITFHHGAGQINHMLPATAILGKQIIHSCNVFVLKAQHHASVNDYLSNAVDSFFHQQQTFAGSVLATEEIVKYHKKHSKKPIVVSGASMGGIVASLHAIFFGSGNYYVPLTAYPNVGEIFLGYEYRSAVAGWAEKRKQKAYLESYALDKPIPRTLIMRIFPVLGKFDRIVPFENAFGFWKKQGITPIVFPYGHFTSFISRRQIRKIITDIL